MIHHSDALQEFTNRKLKLLERQWHSIMPELQQVLALLQLILMFVVRNTQKYSQKKILAWKDSNGHWGPCGLALLLLELISNLWGTLMVDYF